MTKFRDIINKVLYEAFKDFKGKIFRTDGDKILPEGKIFRTEGDKIYYLIGKIYLDTDGEAKVKFLIWQKDKWVYSSTHKIININPDWTFTIITKKDFKKEVLLDNLEK